MELIDAMSLLFSDSGFDMLVYLDSGAQRILLSFGYEAFHYPLQAATSFSTCKYHKGTMVNEKVNVLVNEALRILRNCSEHLPDEVKTSHLQYLVNRMQFSGYPQSHRHEVIARAFKKHRENKHRQESGEPRRIRNKRTWYNEEKYDGVMFVDTTENGELKKSVDCVQEEPIEDKGLGENKQHSKERYNKVTHSD